MKYLINYALCLFVFYTTNMLAQQNVEGNSPTARWNSLEPKFIAGDEARLAKLLTDTSDDVRVRAIQLLGLSASKKDDADTEIKLLLKVFNEEPNNNVRMSVLWSLELITKGVFNDKITYKRKENKAINGHIGDVMVGIIKAPNEWGKELAIRILTNLGGDSRIENELMDMVKSQNSNFSSAAQCLAVMKSGRAIQILINKLIYLINNPEDTLPETKNGLSVFSENGKTKPPISETMLNVCMGVIPKFGPMAVPELLPLLNNDNQKVRYAGAMILGKIGDNRAVPILCEILGKSTNSDEKMLAIYYLEDMKDKRAIPALKEALKDKNTMRMNRLCRPVALAAYQALIKFDIKVEVKYPKEGEPPVYRVVE